MQLSYSLGTQKTKVSSRYLDMAKRIQERHKQLYNKDVYYGVYGRAGRNAMGQYFEIIQKAGTIDADEVMRVTRGGTIRNIRRQVQIIPENRIMTPISFSAIHAPWASSKVKKSVYVGEYPVNQCR